MKYKKISGGLRKKGFLNSAKQIGYKQTAKYIFLNRVDWI